MIVYRIVLERWSSSLMASGQAARWNSRGRFTIYTAGSRALACLENVVHRSGEGLNQSFRTMVVEVPDGVFIKKTSLDDLPADWHLYANYHLTQTIGDAWLAGGESAVLQVPSAVVPLEVNYLLNPLHADFRQVKLLRVEGFVFDPRIKD